MACTINCDTVIADRLQPARVSDNVAGATQSLGRLARWVQYGASPRATITLDRCARAHAWLQGRDYVSPDDIHAIAPDVLRHRVLLSYQAEAEGITPDRFIGEILRHVAVP